MLKTSRLAVPVLLAAMVLTQAAPVLAAPAAPITNHEVMEDVVVWILPAGQCPNLPAEQTVIGFGDRVTTMDTALYEDGHEVLSWDQTVTGTALGTDGTRYTFYSTDAWTAYDPGNGADVQFRIHDLFLLQSPAAAAENTYVLRSAFDWRWTFDANALPFEVWPPTDLQKTTTYGDPVGAELEYVCDPL